MALSLRILLLHHSSGSSYASEQSPTKVERLDPAANDIIPAVLLKLSTGYTWTEGPIWTKEGSALRGYSQQHNSQIAARRRGEHIPATQRLSGISAVWRTGARLEWDDAGFAWTIDGGGAWTAQRLSH